jgi:replicative DNA helicase
MVNKKKNKDTSVDVSENAFAMEQAIGGMVPPNAKDVEMKILGAIMLDNEILADCYEILKPEMFYSPANGIIFEAMLKLEQKSSPIDIVTVKEYLKNLGKLDSVGDVDYLMLIMESVSTSANAVFHCNLVKEPWIHRRLIHTGAVLSDKAQDPLNDAYMLLDEAETTIMEISGSLTQRKEICVADELEGWMASLEESHRTKKAIDGIPYGFDSVDEMTGGAHKGELIIMAARPSHGKTAMAMNMASNAAINYDKKVAIFSIEMSAKELGIRLISSVCKVDGKKLKLGRLSEQAMQQVRDNVEKLRTGLFIDDSSSPTILEIRSKARKMKAEHNIDMIVVDYLQIVGNDSNAERRDLDVAAVSRGLKALAKDLDIPVIACCQLNRDVEKRANKQPTMADLRESGAIEQDADVIIFTYRPFVGSKIDPKDPDYDKIKRQADISIGKQRNGPTGQCYNIIFMSEWATFENHISRQPNFENQQQEDESLQPF